MPQIIQRTSHTMDHCSYCVKLYKVIPRTDSYNENCPQSSET